MSYTTLEISDTQHVRTLTLTRPKRLNALDTTMVEEILDALDSIDGDDSLRACIVTGAGRAFCAGADLAKGGATFDYHGGSELPHRDGGGLIALRLYQCNKPIIAAVNGAAVGVGATMTLPMDIRIASTRARFGFVFARRGIVPEACSSWFLPRIVGIERALEWTYSGRVFDAGEALEGRLVSAVVEPDQLLEHAHRLASEIAANTSAVSVTLTRAMMWRMLGATHPMEAHRIDSRAIQYMGRSADAREGVSAFLEKRDPRFTMSVNEDLPDFFPWWEEPPFS